MKGFTDEAEAAYFVALENYGSELEVRARNRTRAEIVIKADVDAAVSQLRPRSIQETIKVAADWVKRLAFLFIGFTIVQFDKVHGQSPIDAGSVDWLVGNAITASVLLTVGIALDRWSLRADN